MSAPPRNATARRRRPNIVLIITDQERSHRHWPPGWAEENLPNHYDRLVGCRPRGAASVSAGRRRPRSSVTFPNAFTATTECSPSRASLLTSSYPTEHGVVTTPGGMDPRRDLGSDGAEDGTTGRPNLLRLLAGGGARGGGEGPIEDEGGYDVAWKGKWHLFPSARQAGPDELKRYGATSPWNPPDAGHSLWREGTLGGGRKYNHDGRFLRGFKSRFDTVLKDSDDDHTSIEATKRMMDPAMESDSDSASSEEEEEECIFDFLAKHTISDSKRGDETKDTNETQPPRPFFLVASLVNPHDVWASSCFSDLTDEEFYQKTGYHPRDFESLPIELPPNHKDDLSTKPVIQRLLNEHRVFGDLSDGNGTRDRRQSDALRYVRFYAHCHREVDAEIGSLLDALDATGRTDDTIVIRTADHGELALSHGLREKRMQCYEETMGIPLVVNYPSGWFDDAVENGDAVANGGAGEASARSVPSLVSSVDILPTITELAGLDCSRHGYRGRSLVPFLRNGQNAVLDERREVLFTFDEPLAPPHYPGYVRCLRAPDIKYAVYFTPDGQVVEYEMYDLEADPYEMTNLCGPNVEVSDRWLECHERLTALMRRMGAVPSEFQWEEMTKPRKYSWG